MTDYACCKSLVSWCMQMWKRKACSGPHYAAFFIKNVLVLCCLQVNSGRSSFLKMAGRKAKNFYSFLPHSSSLGCWPMVFHDVNEERLSLVDLDSVDAQKWSCRCSVVLLPVASPFRNLPDTFRSLAIATDATSSRTCVCIQGEGEEVAVQATCKLLLTAVVEPENILDMYNIFCDLFHLPLIESVGYLSFPPYL